MHSRIFAQRRQLLQRGEPAQRTGSLKSLVSQFHRGSKTHAFPALGGF
ncbi:hypothetical protein [Scytonema sp. NUACC21]